MKINTALILCAGYGKRLNPITLSLPKPLIEIRDRSLLSRTIELIVSLGIKNIKINSFYLSDQIVECIRNSNYKNNIEIINDGDFILDTGGGVKNMIQYFKQDDFLVFNPDTIWDINYKDTIIKMIDCYYENKLSNLLLVVNKKKSFDKKLNGDFNLRNKKLKRETNNQYIYIGLQILNRRLLEDIEEKKFSMNTVWNKQLIKSSLNGFESKEEFIHLTDIEIYDKLKI
tara:strand:+ start:2632 stop:3318 length:687 start_codon:yes stop_codon:yes gene_type:complete